LKTDSCHKDVKEMQIPKEEEIGHYEKVEKE
jgi:hypothetical protein